jgi:hypothetical protein
MQGTVHALRTIAATEGASGLMRGIWPTVLSNAPFSALYYMLYSDLRRRFQKVRITQLGASACSMLLCGHRSRAIMWDDVVHCLLWTKVHF